MILDTGLQETKQKKKSNHEPQNRGGQEGGAAVVHSTAQRREARSGHNNVNTASSPKQDCDMVI